MFKVFLFVFITGQISWANWQDIAYDKRFDELSWTEILNILETEKKFETIAGVLKGHQKEIPLRDWQYFYLLSETQTGRNVDTFLGASTPLSSQESALRWRIYIKNNKIELALEELSQVQSGDLLPEDILSLASLEFWSLAFQKYSELLTNPKIYSFQILEMLEKIKKISLAKYHLFLEAFKTARSEDELVQQLWIESVFTAFPYGAWVALQEYCQGEGKYCYNAIELGRQLGFWSVTDSNLPYLQQNRDYYKSLLHKYLEQQNYLGILSLQKELEREELLDDPRYRYAVIYSAYYVGDCQKFKESSQALKDSPSYKKKILQLSASSFCQI